MKYFNGCVQIHFAATNEIIITIIIIRIEKIHRPPLDFFTFVALIKTYLFSLIIVINENTHITCNNARTMRAYIVRVDEKSRTSGISSANGRNKSCSEIESR